MTSDNSASSMTLGAGARRTGDEIVAVRRLGFWSSAISAALSAAYLVMLITFFGTQGFIFPPSPVVQLTAGVITFLTAPTLLVVFVAIREIPGTGGALGTVGVCFAVLFAAVVCINRFVQLPVIQQAPAGANTPDLARFVPYSTGSVMFALEMLGWGFFIALAAIFVAPLFSRGPLQHAIRWTLIAFGVLSLLSAIGFVSATPLTAVGFVAWGPLLLALAVMLAIFFRTAVPDHHASDRVAASTRRHSVNRS
jgi:hypothetical protein